MELTAAGTAPDFHRIPILILLAKSKRLNQNSRANIDRIVSEKQRMFIQIDNLLIKLTISSGFNIVRFSAEPPETIPINPFILYHLLIVVHKTIQFSKSLFCLIGRAKALN